MNRFAGLAAGAVWLLAAMPALAQTPTSVGAMTEAQQSEYYCVYDYVDFFADRAKLAAGYIAGDPDAADYQDQMDEVDGAAADCAEEYGWAEDRTNAASMIGFYGVMVDELETRLVTLGLKETDLDAVYDVFDKVSEDDLRAFVDGVWIENEGVLQRLKAELAAKGIKGDAVFRDASYLAEAYIVVSLLTYEWLKAMPKS